MSELTEKDTVTRVEIKGKKVILLGTAHVSRESVKEVETLITEEKPDMVCVEIDAARYKSMTEEKKWGNLDIVKVIKEKRGFLLLANLVLASFQKKLGANLGIKPGEEMKKAISVADENSIPFSFCDREVHVTLRRAWSKSGFWGKNKMLAVLLSSVFSEEKLSEEDIERLKKKSALQDMMEELAKFLPSAKKVLIDERDRFLASRIYTSAGKKIVAVVGAGHVPGLVDWLKKFDEKQEDTNIDDINSVPPKSKFSKIISWIIPVVIVVFFIMIILARGWEEFRKVAAVWIVANSGFAALGAILSMAHPLTVLVASLTAPITSLLPFIGVGIPTGLVESILKKPRVKDLENLSEDILTTRGFFRNRVTHILLVALFSSLGSVIGTIIGGGHALKFLTPVIGFLKNLFYTVFQG